MFASTSRTFRLGLFLFLRRSISLPLASVWSLTSLASGGDPINRPDVCFTGRQPRHPRCSSRCCSCSSAVTFRQICDSPFAAPARGSTFGFRLPFCHFFRSAPRGHFSSWNALGAFFCLCFRGVSSSDAFQMKVNSVGYFLPPHHMLLLPRRRPLTHLSVVTVK